MPSPSLTPQDGDVVLSVSSSWLQDCCFPRYFVYRSEFFRSFYQPSVYRWNK